VPAGTVIQASFVWLQVVERSGKISGDKSIVAYMQEEFNGGPDYTFECVGNVHVMRQALESAHKGMPSSSYTICRNIDLNFVTI
jgi:Zn-dependent alcohol dehydrogenase